MPTAAVFKKHVLITGSTSGIGLATAIKISQARPTRIVLNGRNQQRGEAALNKLRSQAPDVEAIFVAADVSTPIGAQHLLDQTSVFLSGKLNVLVNSAGGDFSPVLFHEMPLEQVEKIFSHWVMSTIYCCRLAMPILAEGAAIINIASDAGKVPTPGESVIGGAMAAITMFSRTLAMEAKRHHIRVNAITPSLVNNTLTFKRVTEDGFSAKLFAKAIKAAHLGVTEPEDVAALIAFLASDDAKRITGQVISVNGGISA